MPRCSTRTICRTSIHSEASSVLLASINHFLAKQARRERAQKRGGGVIHFSLDYQVAEQRYCQEPSHSLTPDKIFERRWALTFLELVFTRLREEFAEAGKTDLFEHLKGFLTGDSAKIPYRALADRLDMTEGAVKVAVHRLRRRCQAVLREEIAQTVAEPAEVEEELKDLFRAVRM